MPEPLQPAGWVMRLRDDARAQLMRNVLMRAGLTSPSPRRQSYREGCCSMQQATASEGVITRSSSESQGKSPCLEALPPSE